jgi:hypothetical protein
MAELKINQMPDDFSDGSWKITEAVTEFLDRVARAGKEGGLDRDEVLSGLMSGILTSVARFDGCPHCAGLIIKDAGEALNASATCSKNNTEH